MIRGVICYVWFILVFVCVGDKVVIVFGFWIGVFFDVNNMFIFFKWCYKGFGLLEIVGFRG